jgi:heme/copper-type cytochrome/quinol oxidase subunit 4
MSRQTKTTALIEACASVGIGFVVSIIITAIVMPLYGHHVTLSQNIQITLIFTVASIVRSYVMRRIFDHLQHRGRA